MRTIMARNPNDSFSFSRRYFNFKKKVDDDVDDDEEGILRSASLNCDEFVLDSALKMHALPLKPPPKKPKNLPSLAVSKLRAAFTFGSKSRCRFPGLGHRVVGTLFGYRRGHVHFAFQEEAALKPAFLVELATPTSVLVREMASGLVRIALECDRSSAAAAAEDKKKKGSKSLLEEPLWRTYCNGRKCGYATRRECGAEEWKVLNAVGPITMGAGVLPPADVDAAVAAAGEGQGELMYMRARFERVVGSRDSEAFYMMNPDGHGGPELSIYLLRV